MNGWINGWISGWMDGLTNGFGHRSQQISQTAHSKRWQTELISREKAARTKVGVQFYTTSTNKVCENSSQVMCRSKIDGQSSVLRRPEVLPKESQKTSKVNK